MAQNVFTAGRGLNALDLTRIGDAIANTYFASSTVGGAVTTSSGMTVAVAAVAANTVTINGIAVATPYAGGTVTLDASDPTNPRIDSIYYDSAGAVGKSTGTAVAVTATTGPTPPTLSSTQFRLADVYVAATATTISSGDITDRRQVGSVAQYKWIVKAATQTVNNSSTLQDDAYLQFPVTASHDYLVEMGIQTTSATATPDFKFAWTLTGMTWDGTYDNAYATGAQTRTQSSANASAAAITLSSASIPTALNIYAQFLIHAGSTGGTLKFQWAQGSATAENTSVLKNSWLRYRDLGAS